MTGDGTHTVAAALTDGTGVSPITPMKFVKDFVADFLLAVPVALLAAGITTVPTDEKTAVAAAIVIAGPLIKAAYRAVLRWATT